MNARHVTTKLISIFLLTFVCLNAGGAMCVTFCLSSGDSELSSFSASHHCETAGDEGGDGKVSLVPAHEAKPCPMTASLLGGPIERSVVSTLKSLPAVVTYPEQFIPQFPRSHYTRQHVPFPSPPLLDRRMERIMHRVLLI